MSYIKTGNGKDIMVLVYSCIPHKKKSCIAYIRYRFPAHSLFKKCSYAARQLNRQLKIKFHINTVYVNTVYINTCGPTYSPQSKTHASFSVIVNEPTVVLMASLTCSYSIESKVCFQRKRTNKFMARTGYIGDLPSGTPT